MIQHLWGNKIKMKAFDTLELLLFTSNTLYSHEYNVVTH